MRAKSDYPQDTSILWGVGGKNSRIADRLIWFGCVRHADVVRCVVAEALSQGEQLARCDVAGMFVLDVGEGPEPMVGCRLVGSTGVEASAYVRVLSSGGALEAVPVGVTPLADRLLLDGGLAALMDGEGDHRKLNPAGRVGVREPVGDLDADAGDSGDHGGLGLPQFLGDGAVGAARPDVPQDGGFERGEGQARRNRFRRWLGHRH